MNGTTRRGFLLSALTFAGAAVLVSAGLLRRAARRVLIPVKPIDRRRFREPNDLAG
jgi:hypothetical protein